MSPKYCKAIAFACALSLPVVSAHAARLGHPGVSTKGATAAARQWNIISDPAYATMGSDTTQYSSNATISYVYSIFPYTVQSVTVVLQNSGLPTNQRPGSYNPYTYQTYTPTDGYVYIDPATFGGKQEAGQVQVTWKLQPGQMPPAGSDDNTDGLIFDQKTTAPTATATFSDVMKYYGSTPGVPAPDYYTGVLPQTGPGGSTQNFTYSSDPHSPFYVAKFQTDSVTLPTGYHAVNTGGGGGEGAVVTRGISVTPEPTTLGVVGLVSAFGLLRRKRAAR